jgi:hypothetical protein
MTAHSYTMSAGWHLQKACPVGGRGRLRHLEDRRINRFVQLHLLHSNAHRELAAKIDIDRVGEEITNVGLAIIEEGCGEFHVLIL